MDILQQINNPKQKVKEIWNERSMTKTIYMLITASEILLFAYFSKARNDSPGRIENRGLIGRCGTTLLHYT